jgi:F-type H+-transporting ATPase subunit delta
MSVTRIASRYAKSLFELAEKDGKLDKIHEDVLYIREVGRNKEFASVMKNPLISTEKKEAIFEAVFKEKVDLITLNTLMVLAEHKREAYLVDVCTFFHSLYNTKRRITYVTVTTAVEMGASEIEGILAEFKAKGLIEQEVELETKVDPSIIGGFIVQFNDQLYDASVKDKLDGLRKKFSENLYIKNI